MAKKSNPIESFIVFDADGRVDVEASIEATTAAVDEFATESEATQTLVMGCINALFDSNVGKRFPQASIIANAVDSIRTQVPDLADISRYPALVKMANGVLKSAVQSGYLNVLKGPSGGGTGRTSDCPKPAPKTPKAAK